MVKLIACLKRRPGVSPQQFQRHWRTRHAQIVVRQAGLRRYVQNHVLPEVYGAGEPPFDGVAEAWFDDVDAMRRLAPSPEYRAVRDDEPQFLDVPAMKVVLADDIVVIDGAEPADALRVVFFLTRKAGTTPDEFQRYWRETHAPLARRLPLLRRYVQSHARLGGYAAGRAPAFDGIAFASFDDSAALAVTGGSHEGQRVFADQPSFLVPGRAPFLLTRGLEIAL